MAETRGNIDYGDRTVLLDRVGARCYLFEATDEGYDLLGSIIELGPVFSVECYWRPRPDAGAEADSFEEGVLRLLELADGSAMARSRWEVEGGPASLHD